MAAAAKQMMISEGGKNFGPNLATSRPKVLKFWDNVGGPFVISNAVSGLSLSSSTPEIFALKFTTELRNRRK